VSDATLPSWVPMPVARTIASASPPVHAVPLKIRFGAARGSSPGGWSPATRSTAIDSPVSVDMSTSTAPLTSRASAEMRAPSSTTIRSPGTSSAAGTLIRMPPRMTVAVAGM
jgi:hypothetical protein